MNKNFSIVPKLVFQNPVMSYKVAKTFVNSLKTDMIDRKLYRGFSKKLSLIYFRITPLCNLKCVMCGQRGDKGVLKGEYAKEEAKNIVPLETYKKLVDEIAPDRPIFYMWGGEPFLYPYFMDLSEYIVNKKCLLSVNTNGTFLKKEAERIVRDKWHALFVSLDGFEDVNDEIRGKGSYKRVIDGFKEINRQKKLQKSTLPHMGIVTTVSNLNYMHLDKLVEAVKDFDLSWHFINLGTYSNNDIVKEHTQFMKDNLDTNTYCLEAYNTGYNEGIDGNEFSKILKKIHSLKPGYPIITVPTIKPEKIGEYYSNLDVIVRDKCTVPWSQCNIDYNGDVHFCADYPEYILGNIKDDKLFNILNNERSVKFRNTLKNTEHGLFPGCVRCYQNMLFGHKIKGY
ncbi:MAG: radical SAM protein [Spirochaetales bacterium]|nr:radical SAM protein [Spirochaetales bacterium]